MNYKMIGRFLSKILLVEAVFMLPALAISLGYGEMDAVKSFLWTLFVILVVGMALHTTSKKADHVFFAREGLVCVGFSWIVLSLVGALPFFIEGAIPNYLDALFETVSGFTTTGASILPEVESLPKGLLYWRSFSHWLGGMGVLVFILAIDPAISRGGRGRGYTMHLMRAESPGPDVGKLVPKMKDTAKILYMMYILLTIITIVLLLCGGMNWLEAFCTAFGVAGTGGFGVKNDSIASYSPYIQYVCTIFMILFGVNFSCYYLMLIRHFKNVFKDEELRTYFGLIIGSIILIAWNIQGVYGTLEETIRHASFQVASIITTTGFATADFDLWPNFSKTILLLLMFVGASAGSTGGGFKCGRALIVIKSLRRSIRKVLDPQKVQIVRNNGSMINEKVVQATNGYLAAYAVILMLSFLLISLDGFSVETNLSAVAACFNNIGPGLDAVGPTCNYSAYSMFSKVILILDMLAGRLEIFPILILFSGSTWVRR